MPYTKYACGCSPCSDSLLRRNRSCGSSCAAVPAQSRKGTGSVGLKIINRLQYGGSLENRLRFTLETAARVREAVGPSVPIAVRLGGADYLPGGSKEEDAAEGAALLEAAGVDLIDLSGGMCFYFRPGHLEPGYFSSMSEKVKARVSVPVLLTGGVQHAADAEKLLSSGKADLIGVGRALLKDAHWRETA